MRKVDVKNHQFGWVRFENRVFKDDKKCKSNSTVNKLFVKEKVEKIKIYKNHQK